MHHAEPCGQKSYVDMGILVKGDDDDSRHREDSVFEEEIHHHDLRFHLTNMSSSLFHAASGD